MADLLALNPNVGVYRCKCDDLDDFYRELGCRSFDIATRKVGGVYYDMFVDDIGLFKPLRVSAVSPEGDPMLVGNIIFANHDDQGNTTDLSDADIKRIINAVMFVIYSDGEGGMCIECEY